MNRITLFFAALVIGSTPMFNQAYAGEFSSPLDCPCFSREELVMLIPAYEATAELSGGELEYSCMDEVKPAGDDFQTFQILKVEIDREPPDDDLEINWLTIGTIAVTDEIVAQYFCIYNPGFGFEEIMNISKTEAKQCRSLFRNFYRRKLYITCDS